MHSDEYQCNITANRPYQLPSTSCSTSHTKSCLLTKNGRDFSGGKKSGSGAVSRKTKNKTECVRGLGRRRRKKEKKKKKEGGDSKGESNNSPEILDRRMPTDIYGFPSGLRKPEQKAE